MRILLTGLPSTGKTTLSTALSEAMGLHCVVESASDLAAAGADVGPDTSWGTRASILVLQQHREPAVGSYIADRGAPDVMAYARLAERTAEPEDQLSCLLGPAIRTVCSNWFRRAQYDLIFFHQACCGERGNDLEMVQPNYLSGLRTAFRDCLLDLKAETVDVPGALGQEERTNWALSIIEAHTLQTAPVVG